MNKIIGFLVIKNFVDLRFDFFNAGLTVFRLKISGLHVYLWGIGNIGKCIINQSYSLSFPLHDSLLDRNVLLSIKGDRIVIENDWLGSIPIFYNKNEIIISTLPNLCLVNKNVSLDGLFDFCEFGYSVFEQTVFEDVRFMRYYSKLTCSEHEVFVEYKDDPVLKKNFLSGNVSETDVIDLIRCCINNLESDFGGRIVIPISGGYDSRLLTNLVSDKSGILGYTYGVSENQMESYEVVYAKKLSEIFSIRWRQIELNSFNDYIEDWFGLYGFSTHLHGMYHIEFYKKIIESGLVASETVLLSGIVGDAWSDYGKFKNIDVEKDLINLGFNHGVCLDTSILHLPSFSSGNARKIFFDNHIGFLKDDRIKAVFVVRAKMILLSYLTQVPEYFGMFVSTPFLNYEIVRSILSINDARRYKRCWQTDYFASTGSDLERMKLSCRRDNDLDYSVGTRQHFEPIDTSIMADYFCINRLNDINYALKDNNFFKKMVQKQMSIKSLIKLIGYKSYFIRNLNQYYIIKAFEKGLKYGP